MDGHGFDRFARSLVAPGSRRRLLAAWCGATVTVVAAAVGFAKRPTDAQTCAAEDEPCTLMVTCCSGLICATLPLNVNSGVCVPGVVQSAPENDPGDGRKPRPTNTSDPTKTPKPSKTPSPDRTPKPTKTPESNKRASLRLQLRCQGTDEALEIENTGDTAVTIERIESLAVPAGTGKHSFNVDRELPSGGSVTFTSGRDAEKTDNRLTGEELYRDEDNANAVEVTASGGVFRAPCPKKGGSGNGNDNDDGGREKLHRRVEYLMDIDAEITTITNVGPVTVRVTKIDGHRIPRKRGVLYGRESPECADRDCKTSEQYVSGYGANVPDTSMYKLTPDRIYTEARNYQVTVETHAGNKFTATCEPEVCS
jgi:hypothetical protein